jgi:acyl-CoA synthetase (AMP-forming)/AMP-acid ligase II
VYSDVAGLFSAEPLEMAGGDLAPQGHAQRGPNFAYELCVHKIGPEQLPSLDLSSWTTAFNGAEPIRAGTLDRFAEMFAPCGFRKEDFFACYGLAEATLIVTGSKRSAPPVIKHLRAGELEPVINFSAVFSAG